MKKLFTLFILLILSFRVLYSQNLESKSLRDSLLKEWKKIREFKSEVSKKLPDFGFYSALIYEGKIISEETAGYANRETKLPFNTNTIFMWGSISKMFTSVAILQLKERNQLKIDDPITKYIPELGSGVDSLGGMKNIKIYHLLNHISGISLRPSYDSLKASKLKLKLGRIPTIDEISPYLKYSTQLFTPGTKYEYSNGGYSLLGVVVERITKMKFTKYVTKNIFKPLGMKTAHYGTTSNKLMKYHAKSYVKWKGKMYKFLFNRFQGFQEGNGGVKATVKDMVKFMDFLRFRKQAKKLKQYEKVLPYQTIRKYYFDVNFNAKNSTKYSTQLIADDIKVYRVSGFIRKVNTKPYGVATGHSGNIEYYNTVFFYNNEYPYGIILLCNTDSYGEKTNVDMASARLYRMLYDYSMFPILDFTTIKWLKSQKK